ncbi:GTPase HflX [Taylorella equigenitalis]|uniref:GTPase HflX n=1 Tax=Taylorella equigenitalis TaxID=29575 RepID=UPI00041CE804|nr:GTPase HflX [Taylorella equigenitalis]WDU45772.1 GTPase HflX [Taylorella equigenitalis]
MKAIVISVNFNDSNFDSHLSEFQMLATGAGAQILETVVAKRDKPDAKFFIGSGKVEEVVGLISIYKPEIILFDQALSPAQQRNLERAFGLRVIDRVTLILDIFALRAKSHEGKLQVELAQLQHLITRLTRLWTHLERQRGGIGMRGPGESQLEMDRRMIGDKVKQLKERLAKLDTQRLTQRRARARSNMLSVSLVGYTNAGKSTLFNALTRAGTYEADQLFATLDTTTRRIWIEDVGQVTISDTVGFIRDLPTTLIAAFKATLEETVHADLPFHVVDAANPQRDEQILEVNKVLKEINAEDIPTILVYNKIDLLEQGARIETDEQGKINRIFVSSKTREGMNLLRKAIAEFKSNI